MSAVTDYLRRQHFNVTVQVLLYPYTGTVDANKLLIWDDPIDITDDIKNIGDLVVSEGVLDTSSDSAAQIPDKTELALDNTRGKYDPTGSIFTGNVMNNSKVVITSRYVTFIKDVNGILVPTIITGYSLFGLLKSLSSSYEVSNRTFRAGVMSCSASFNGVKARLFVSAAISQHIRDIVMDRDSLDADSPNNIKSIIDRDLSSADVWYLINLGITEHDSDIDKSADMSNTTALQFLNRLCFIGLAIWKITQDAYLVVAAINNSGSSVWDLTVDDIVAIDDIGYYPIQFTKVTWSDNLHTVYSSAMSEANRVLYGYEVNEKTIPWQYIEDVSGTRLQSLCDQILTQYQHRHRMITLTTKTNPELAVNDIITINHPAQAGLNSMVISSTIKWRVLTIKRSVTFSTDMQIVAVQAGTGPDANLDGS